jgi:predicted phosphate transport protein (TIGR00153 family)
VITYTWWVAKRRLVPMIGVKAKEEKFYSLFQEGAETVFQGALLLKEAVSDPTLVKEMMTRITEVEHHGDQITRTIIDHLNQTFITPLDREDIYTLAQKIDDILDYIEGTIERMMLYKTGQAAPDVVELVDILVETRSVIKSAFVNLRSLRHDGASILKSCQEINLLESKGDHLYRAGVARLFEEVTDPIEIIKWKEIYEHIETALDHCEDVSDVLKGVVLKYS